MFESIELLHQPEKEKAQGWVVPRLTVNSLCQWLDDQRPKNGKVYWQSHSLMNLDESCGFNDWVIFNQPKAFESITSCLRQRPRPQLPRGRGFRCRPRRHNGDLVALQVEMSEAKFVGKNHGKKKHFYLSKNHGKWILSQTVNMFFPSLKASPRTRQCFWPAT